MKIALVHPLKHHSYYSFLGIKKTKYQCKAILGFYKKNDLIDYIISKTAYSKLVDGYELADINEYVYSSKLIKILFLLYKISSKYFQKLYFKIFEKWSIKKTVNFDCIHVLQSYCNDLIRVANERGQDIIYEQITIFDGVRRREWEKLADEYGYDKKIIDKYIPLEGLDTQIENLRMAKIVIVASQNVADSLEGIVPSKKIKIINYGGNPVSSFQTRKIYKKEKLKVLYIGSLNLLKGIQYIISVAKRMEEEDKDVEFTFIGKPNDIQDKRWVDEIKLLKNSTYIESVPHIEINTVYKGHDIFIFQPICEGFGMVTLEAMSCGLPCIVSQGGRGIIQNKNDGFINENGNIEEIIKNIRYFKQNPDKISEMGKNAYKNAKENTWENYSEKIKEVYELL